MSMFKSTGQGVTIIGRPALKYLFLGLAAVLWFASEIPPAKAVVCARGVYRAGCVGPRGAAVVRAPVVHPRCFWRAGVRVCR
jgi:hypothetical protein